jgi:hypothetical protein
MNKKLIGIVVLVVAAIVVSCDNGMSTTEKRNTGKPKIDRSRRTVIDSAQYVDFTVAETNAIGWKWEDLATEVSGRLYKNGNSFIKINRSDKTIEMSSDVAFFNGSSNRQFYAKYGFDVQGASSDCLYIRKDPQREGQMIVDNMVLRNDEIPDLAVCIPLYGYSRNRIEVSPVMNGFVAMPSGTYWYGR